MFRSLALSAAALVLSVGASAQSVPRIVDGDSLAFGSQRVRLAGIDAPELHQECGGWQAGQEARLYLGWLISARPVACDYSGQDRYGRQLGTCFVPSWIASSSRPLELNRAMVRTGMAWAYVRYSNAYVADETAARTAKRGIWAHDCEAPWLWRREHK